MTGSIKMQSLNEPTTEKSSESQDDTRFPTGIRLVTIIASILLAMFLVALVEAPCPTAEHAH